MSASNEQNSGINTQINGNVYDFGLSASYLGSLKVKNPQPIFDHTDDDDEEEVDVSASGATTVG